MQDKSSDFPGEHMVCVVAKCMQARRRWELSAAFRTNSFAIDKACHRGWDFFCSLLKTQCQGVNFRHAFPVFSARRLEFSASTAENSKRLAHFCSLGGRKTKTEKHAPEMGECFSVCLAKVWEIGLFLPTYILRMWSLQASISHLGVEVAPQMPTVFAPSNHSDRMASGPSTM